MEVTRKIKWVALGKNNAGFASSQISSSPSRFLLAEGYKLILLLDQVKPN